MASDDSSSSPNDSPAPENPTPDSPLNGVAPPQTPEEAAPAQKTADPPKEPEKPKILCREKAKMVVHKYAALGTVVGALPIPVPVSPGLVAIETHLVYWISRAYGEELSYAESAVVASGLGVASEALKVVARSVAGLIPVVGWGVKGVIAGGCVEALGFAAIRHFEKKSPNKMTTV